MPYIHLTTIVHAPVKRVFDLSRSVSLHKISMQHANEMAIAGTTSGLVKEGDTITWQAKHLYKVRKMKVRIAKLKPYDFFEDVMLHGDFREMKHRHYFKGIDNGTIVIDEFEFEVPYGLLGKIICRLFLTSYLKKLLLHRNSVIKDYAESGRWKTLLAPS
jgi:ligand-binding SRPBCC domain-containing protein